MNSFTRFGAAAAALATLALAGCSDTMVQPTVNQRVAPAAGPNAVLIPVLSDVIVGSNGAFTNTTAPANLIRSASTAFWDNHSSDEGIPPFTGRQCNIGFFAVGTITNDCEFNSGSSPGGYSGGAYYGSNAGGGFGSPDFMFKGTYEYDVKLVGAYSFGSSHVGYFTKSGGVYTFTEVPTWSSKTFGATVSFSTGGADWGFFAFQDAPNNNFTDVFTCGGLGKHVCSDATGGFSPSIPPSAGGIQPQQFALFINSTRDQFLVGFEDNILNLWPGACNSGLGIGSPGCSPDNTTNQDSDYQDYIFNIVPHIIPSGGCTFTKGWYRNHGSNTIVTVDGRTVAQAQAIFAATPGKPGGVTWQGGNDLLNLYQQLLAAILNGGTSGPSGVQAAIAAAQAGTGGSGLNITTTLSQADISSLTNTLDNFNSGNDAGFPHCGG